MRHKLGTKFIESKQRPHLLVEKVLEEGVIGVRGISDFTFVWTTNTKINKQAKLYLQYNNQSKYI